MQSHTRKIPISYHAEYQNQVILLRTGKIDPSKTALEEVGFNQNLGFHQNDHKNHDHQVAMCTLAFLELVNEGNIQAQVVAIIIIVFFITIANIALLQHNCPCHHHHHNTI